MIKKALKSACWVPLGVTLGACVLPRICFPDNYNETWPPIWKEALIYFAIGYVMVFMITLLTNWISSKLGKRK